MDILPLCLTEFHIYRAWFIPVSLQFYTSVTPLISKQGRRGVMTCQDINKVFDNWVNQALQKALLISPPIEIPLQTSRQSKLQCWLRRWYIKGTWFRRSLRQPPVVSLKLPSSYRILVVKYFLPSFRSECEWGTASIDRWIYHPLQWQGWIKSSMSWNPSWKISANCLGYCPVNWKLVTGP